MTKNRDLPPTKQPEMSLKEALAVLHKVYDALGLSLYCKEATQEEHTLRGQVEAAFQLLDSALHGRQTAYRDLCRYCYLNRWAGDILVQIGGRSTSNPCCASCLSRLQAEHAIVRLLRWDADTHHWREVPAC
jgi:hypothetical protein